MLLYTVGFELLHVEDRFLWLDAILLLLLCAYYLFDFVRSTKLRRVLFYLVFLSFWLYPVSLLILHVNQDRDIYITANQLQATYHLKGNFASNNDSESTSSCNLTLFYAYFLDSKYYGATQKQITDKELQRVLGKYHINYYFSWNSVCRLSECRKIAEFEIRYLWSYKTKHLIVYQIINNGSS